MTIAHISAAGALVSPLAATTAWLQGASGAPPAPPPPGGLTGFFSGTPWIDIVGFCVVGLFLVLGIRHGLVWQVTRLIGMLVAVTLARSISPEITPHFESALSLHPRACQGIVWFLVFTASLLVAAMIGMVGKRALEAVQLGPMDRMGGGLAGALTGVIVHCALLVLLSAVGSTDWTARTFKGSASASMLDSLSRKTRLLLDAQAAERIVEPWGQQYDAERFHAQQIQAEEQRRRSIQKAEELRRQAEEEIQRANRQSVPGQPGRVASPGRSDGRVR